MKKFLLSLALLLVAGLPAFAQPATLQTYEPGFRLIDGSQLNLMVGAVNNLQGTGAASSQIYLNKIITTNAPPVATACGTGPVVVGSRVAGEVTMGSGSPTGCVLTFAGAYTSAPFCTVTWQTNLASMQYTVTSTAITLVQTGTSSNKVNWTCIARNGG